jgi:RNA polymerase sigma factor (sigma-70 family)
MGTTNCIEPSHPVKAPGAMDDSEDVKRWSAVVQRRDRAAFVQLYQRHEKAAYNVAFHILRNRDEAEEAVQEAMMRVWKSAQSFRMEGTFRSWFLRIVARESLRKIAQRKRVERKDVAAMVQQDSLGRSEQDFEATLEKREVLAQLKKEVDALPSDDRQLLALHFGGGLSQQEIGEVLSYTQQNVSVRIKKALERLRTNLSTAGMAAALPFIETGGLSETFQSGYAVPPGLATQTLSRFSKLAQESIRRGASAASATSSATTIAVVCVCLAAATGLYVLSAPASRTQAPQAAPGPTATTARTTTPTAVVPAPAPRPFAHKWLFSDASVNNLKVLDGSWQWQAAKAQTPAAMVPPKEIPVWALLPMTIPSRPLQLSARVRLIQGTFIGAQTKWWDGAAAAANRVWSAPQTMDMTNAPMLLRIHIFDQWAVIYLGTNLWALVEYAKPYPADQLILILKNCRLEELEIKEVAMEEIPADVRNTEALIARAGFKVIKDEIDSRSK